MMTPLHKKLFKGLLIMAALSPIGIILPNAFHAEDAWGEWGTETLQRLLGYVPEGLKRHADLWKAPIADYNFGGDNAAMSIQIISYIVSGVLGILLVAIATYAVSRALGKRRKQ